MQNLKKKVMVAALAAAAMLSSITAYAGGDVLRQKNNDGSEYGLLSNPMDSFLGEMTGFSFGSTYDDYCEWSPADDAAMYKDVNITSKYVGYNYIDYMKMVDFFSDLPNAVSVNIENGIEYIYDSFNNCPNLQYVFVPSSVKGISDSFKNSGNCVIYGISGSYAESFAAQNGIPFVNGVQVVIDDTGIVFDQPAFIKDGRTLVPMRKIFEKLGATVDWDDNTKTVTANKNGTTISLQIGSNLLIKNGQQTELDVPAFIQDGSTYVPIRAISESLDASVNWEGTSQTVYITQ